MSIIAHPHRWEKLQCIVNIEAIRHIKTTGIEQKENRIYITSLYPNASKIGKSIRAHWGIENYLHWVLDVSFNEDASRKRGGNAAENFAIVNRIALNLVKNEKSKKRSVKGKRLDAGWNNEFLIKILKN